MVYLLKLFVTLLTFISGLFAGLLANMFYSKLKERFDKDFKDKKTSKRWQFWFIVGVLFISFSLLFAANVIDFLYSKNKQNQNIILTPVYKELGK
jgi:H+/Cl- antiporter ClcA